MRLSSFLLNLAIWALALGCSRPLLAVADSERRPFPQHVVYTRGTIKPSAKAPAVLDRSASDFYTIWKRKYVHPAAPGQLYVFANAEKSFDSPATRSVSEGHGFGMVATVLLAGPGNPQAHAEFDAMVRFFQAHPTENHPHLMSWRQILQPKTGALVELPGERGSATDGDLDIAYALLLADRQWGSAGAIDYRSEARKAMAAILDAEIDSSRNTLALGDWVGDEHPFVGSLRSSDFMPGHLKAFAAASGDARWTRIAESTYGILQQIVARFSPGTGLLPDFIVLRDGEYVPARPKFLEGSHDGQYSYNACRDPWRIGTDYLLSGDPRALALLKPLNAWIQSATGGDPERIGAGYTLSGRPLHSDDHSTAFLAPFAVAAMSESACQPWLDSLWETLVDRHSRDEHY